MGRFEWRGPEGHATGDMHYRTGTTEASSAADRELATPGPATLGQNLAGASTGRGSLRARRSGRQSRCAARRGSSRISERASARSNSGDLHRGAK